MSDLHKAPKTIWLQVDPEGESYDPEYYDADDMTWCKDKINDNDVEYVRADHVAEIEKQRDELLAGLKSARFHLDGEAHCDATRIIDSVDECKCCESCDDVARRVDECMSLREQRDELLAAMQKAADEIRRCDYTPARSTLLTTIDSVKGQQ